VGEPAVKGSIFASVIADLRGARDAGRVSEDKLEERLSEVELELLGSSISSAAWYPMESYVRISDLLCELEGGKTREYFRRRGATNAKRLIEAGFYGQLAFLKRWEQSIDGRDRGDKGAVLQSFHRSLKLVVTLSKNIYSTGDWRVDYDPDRPNFVRIEILDATAYSEGMRYAIEGFLNECVRSVRGTSKPFFTSERVAKDRIRISMTESVVDFYGVPAE
jgi:hypothetical protein